LSQPEGSVRKAGPWVPGEDADSQSARVRAIAIHLPQFHPILENDEWWGKGFTEWTNVAKAKPKFPGHYQPHLPADLGFYDLRLPEARGAQAELAAEYGIYGFCYYHYWFNGRRLLERPVNEIWKSGKPDFPFCLCWANENWTRSWDGQNLAVLVEQHYTAEDDLAHIRALIPMFHDRRYIRVMDRPLFAVYRASEMPDPKRTTELWRREAERAGLRGLFLVRVSSFDQERDDPRALGFDCAVDFQPNARILGSSRIHRRKWWHREKLGTRERWFRENGLFDYAAFAESALNGWSGSYPRIPCVCPGWDNSPRRHARAQIILNSTPELYESWLRETVLRQREILEKIAQSTYVVPESLIFINAWNEWGEGNHLEPCQKWGRAFLEATKRALETSVLREQRDRLAAGKSR
jgi:lipopolysaccharide biosynthesis protein